ncbi:acyl-CoA mutase large subunit family protein [Tunturiibacter gelidoferens]|uniref:Methylmalonyl-CoA mutase N-terminal domain/subunit n=1 Tax=Tunturiibacter gelidiferens TaxID=3069689 RepID=A0ACC5P3K5_9BACT|nr:methylmalonyl-CoA mutase family protein [Edaphobacter lichenicola]MBB5341300.1 methylmalonyl-CoA mutase N-terminal domain/subunit [Edaphobacter lichenicola]
MKQADLKQPETSSGIPVELVYRAEDLEGFNAAAMVGEPGEYPFTRGIQPTMYRGRLWTMRQYAGMGDAEESNKRYKFLLAHGAGAKSRGGLSVAFDLPTQIGYDSDSPLALGEVGKVGVAIDSLEDMQRLFDGIALDTISTSMTINATASILLALYVAVAKRTGAKIKELSGTIQNDILKEYIARGTYIYPVTHAMRLVTDIFAWAAEEVPEWNTISISGYHMREAGCTAVQEVAFTLADGMTYVQAAIDAGLDVDAFAPRLSFFFNSHNNLLEEVAKFRAARRMWAQIMREHFGAKKERSWMLRFHTQTAGSTLTAQQPENNVVRTTLQALAAVLGGTQSLHTNGFDEALSLPTENAARIALRTQQILAHESGVAQTVDPLAGSFYVESLTNEIERRAEEYLATIARFDLGGKYGMLRAIERGYVQREIQNAAYEYQQTVDAKEAIVVGVNEFASEQEVAVPIQRIDEALEGRQVERIRALRARRDAGVHAATLACVEDAARSGENLMPRIVEAVEAMATVGEVADALRRVFGEYRESVVV